MRVVGAIVLLVAWAVLLLVVVFPVAYVARVASRRKQEGSK